jgi:hypothetical protein
MIQNSCKLLQMDATCELIICYAIIEDEREKNLKPLFDETNVI